jgi:GMP synthase (glutamine-hydrolysing)
VRSTRIGSSSRLWIIDPSMAHPEEQGVAEVLGDWPGEYRVLRPALRRADGPRATDGHDVHGVVVMGSRASVHDELEWLSALRQWLRPIVLGQVRVPLLGICFGHQLIAEIAGAAVGLLREDGAKRSGVETSHVSGSVLLPDTAELRVVVSHREHARSCPRGFKQVATREGTPVDGIEHEQLPVFSFQFHPEAREQFAGHAGIDPLLLDARLRRDGRQLLAAFRRVVSDS